jgi:hypothetical protein
VPEEPKRPPRILAADTVVDSPEELARLHQQRHGTIGGIDPVKLPGLPPTDDGATIPVPLLELDGVKDKDGTPPPLPPSPAAASAEVWLEEAVTRPAIVTDLAAMGDSLRDSRSEARSPAFAAFAHEQVSARHARVVLILSSTIFFLVGLILGAILFRR